MSLFVCAALGSVALLLGGCGADCLRDTDCDGHALCSAGHCVVAALVADGGVRTASAEQSGSGGQAGGGGSAGTTAGTSSTPPRGNLDASVDAENQTSTQ